MSLRVTIAVGLILAGLGGAAFQTWRFLDAGEVVQRIEPDLGPRSVELELDPQMSPVRIDVRDASPTLLLLVRDPSGAEVARLDMLERVSRELRQPRPASADTLDVLGPFDVTRAGRYRIESDRSATCGVLTVRRNASTNPAWAMLGALVVVAGVLMIVLPAGAARRAADDGGRPA